VQEPKSVVLSLWSEADYLFSIQPPRSLELNTRKKLWI